MSAPKSTMRGGALRYVPYLGVQVPRPARSDPLCPGSVVRPAVCNEPMCIRRLAFRQDARSSVNGSDLL